MDKTSSPTSFKEIDFSKGFSSWHVKWLVGDYVFERSSRTFALTKGQSQVPERAMNFYLSLLDPTQCSDTRIRVDLLRSGPPKPLFCRLALCYEGEDPIFGKSYYFWRDVRAYEVIFPPDTLKQTTRIMTVHCWIDIPNAVFKEIGITGMKRKNCFGQCPDDDGYELPINMANFGASSDVLYKGVIGADTVFAAMSDVSLVPKKANKADERRFFCHRSILASRSSVFLRMFAEKAWKEGENRIVEIKDIDPETMQIVLYHIYTGKFMAAEPDFLQSIVYAADKYQLNDLKDWAVYQLIIGDFSDADRVDQLLLAERHNLSQLKAVCIAMLSSCVRWSKKEEVSGKVSKELWSEVVDAMEKRQLDTTEITVTNE